MNDTKQKREYWKPSNMLYPLPAVMVSCADEDGRANVMTAAWTGTICSDPVMVYVSIRKERYSHDIIERTGEFVINLTTKKLVRAADYAGVRSGRNEDKFQTLHLTQAPSRLVKAPGIAESPGSNRYSSSVRMTCSSRGFCRRTLIPRILMKKASSIWTARILRHIRTENTGLWEN